MVITWEVTSDIYKADVENEQNHRSVLPPSYEMGSFDTRDFCLEF